MPTSRKQGPAQSNIKTPINRLQLVAHASYDANRPLDHQDQRTFATA